MNNAITIRGLTKQYPTFKLNNITLDIPSGTIVGLIGVNGSGKTTLLKSILNIIKYDRGDITIFGENLIDHEAKIKSEIGIVLDETFFPEILKVSDINTIMKDIYKTWDEQTYKDYLKMFNIPSKQKIKELSKGMRKKLEISTALAHVPKLLILDEPTSGLDPVVRSEMLDVFLNFINDDERTILMSTHITSDLEKIADYIIFIDNGNIIFNENKDTIIEEFGILKCGIDHFDQINKEDIIYYRKNKYNYEILVSDKRKMKNKYPNMIIDKSTLDDIMVLFTKGGTSDAGIN